MYPGTLTDFSSGLFLTHRVLMAVSSIKDVNDVSPLLIV
jgi:hypothetical protein